VSAVSRLDLYAFLDANRAAILDEAGRIGAGLGIPDDLRGRIGTSGTNSALPGTVRADVTAAMEAAAAEVVPLRQLGDGAS
jgi:hypothetical protein